MPRSPLRGSRATIEKVATIGLCMVPPSILNRAELKVIEEDLGISVAADPQQAEARARGRVGRIKFGDRLAIDQQLDMVAAQSRHQPVDRLGASLDRLALPADQRRHV